MNIKQIIKEEIVSFLKTLSEAKFKPGDMWSSDFDYRGMMTYGAKVKVNVGLKTLEKLYDSLEDVNYHSENRLLYPAIESLQKGDKSTAASQLKLFNKACLKTLKTFKEAKLPDEGFSDPDQMREAKMRRVTKSMWKKMDDDARVNALLSAFKDPDDAEEYAEEDWNDLPSVARANMYVYEGRISESTPAKVQKTQSDLVKTIDALKKNFPMYKAAKESGDKSKLEKHRKIALALTKKKKELEKKMDSDLKGLYSDAELQLEKGKGLWANIHAKRKRGGKPAKKGQKGYPDEKAWKSTKKASESKKNVNEGKNFYQDVVDMQKGFRLFKIQSPKTYKELDKKFKIGTMERGLKSLQQYMDRAEMNEDKVNEDVWKSFLNDDPGFKLYTATNTEKRKSVKARATNKTWDDGVPVLKFIARAPLKLSPLPKGKFKIIEDNKYGWWYYQVGSTWYGISQKDYGTPPFEY